MYIIQKFLSLSSVKNFLGKKVFKIRLYAPAISAPALLRIAFSAAYLSRVPLLADAKYARFIRRYTAKRTAFGYRGKVSAAVRKAAGRIGI